MSARSFVRRGKHMDAIHILVAHYQQDYKTDDCDDCLATREHLRFPEKPYESKSCGKYPHMLSNTRDAAMPWIDSDS